MFHHTFRAFAVALVLSAPAWAHEDAISAEDPGADGYIFDKGHTHIRFEISHLGFSTTTGRFNDFDGNVVFDPDAPENTQVQVTVKTASVQTGHEGLDKHLREADFFNTAEFPDMTFVSTGVTRTGEDTATLTGDLTLLGVTKPITLDVKLNKIGAYPIREGITAAGFDASGMIKRSDFGMNTASGILTDDVTIRISTEFHHTAE